MRFHGIYRCLCKDFYIKGRLSCLATDINAILHLYLTFLLTLEQVSVTFRQLPNLPVFCGGRGGGLSKIWACPYFGKCGNLRTVPKLNLCLNCVRACTCRSTLYTTTPPPPPPGASDPDPWPTAGRGLHFFLFFFRFLRYRSFPIPKQRILALPKIVCCRNKSGLQKMSFKCFGCLGQHFEKNGTVDRHPARGNHPKQPLWHSFMRVVRVTKVCKTDLFTLGINDHQVAH